MKKYCFAKSVVTRNHSGRYVTFGLLILLIFIFLVFIIYYKPGLIEGISLHVFNTQHKDNSLAEFSLNFLYYFLLITASCFLGTALAIAINPILESWLKEKLNISYEKDKEGYENFIKAINTINNKFSGENEIEKSLIRYHKKNFNEKEKIDLTKFNNSKISKLNSISNYLYNVIYYYNVRINHKDTRQNTSEEVNQASEKESIDTIYNFRNTVRIYASNLKLIMFAKISVVWLCITLLSLIIHNCIRKIIGFIFNNKETLESKIYAFEECDPIIIYTFAVFGGFILVGYFLYILTNFISLKLWRKKSSAFEDLFAISYELFAFGFGIIISATILFNHIDLEPRHIQFFNTIFSLIIPQQHVNPKELCAYPSNPDNTSLLYCLDNHHIITIVQVISISIVTYILINIIKSLTLFYKVNIYTQEGGSAFLPPELLRLFGYFLTFIFWSAFIYLAVVANMNYGYQNAESQVASLGVSDFVPYSIFITLTGAIVIISTRDLLENFFSGISQHVDAPFDEGDMVKIDESNIMQVKSFGFRLVTFYDIKKNANRYITHKSLSNAKIENFSEPSLDYRTEVSIYVPRNTKNNSSGETVSNDITDYIENLSNLTKAEMLLMLASFYTKGVKIPNIIRRNDLRKIERLFRQSDDINTWVSNTKNYEVVFTIVSNTICEYVDKKLNIIKNDKNNYFNPKFFIPSNKIKIENLQESKRENKEEIDGLENIKEIFNSQKSEYSKYKTTEHSEKSLEKTNAFIGIESLLFKAKWLEEESKEGSSLPKEFFERIFVPDLFSIIEDVLEKNKILEKTENKKDKEEYLKSIKNNYSEIIAVISENTLHIEVMLLAIRVCNSLISVENNENMYPDKRQVLQNVFYNLANSAKKINQAYYDMALLIWSLKDPYNYNLQNISKSDKRILDEAAIILLDAPRIQSKQIDYESGWEVSLALTVKLAEQHDEIIHAINMFVNEHIDQFIDHTSKTRQNDCVGKSQRLKDSIASKFNDVKTLFDTN